MLFIWDFKLILTIIHSPILSCTGYMRPLQYNNCPTAPTGPLYNNSNNYGKFNQVASGAFPINHDETERDNKNYILYNQNKKQQFIMNCDKKLAANIILKKAIDKKKYRGPYKWWGPFGFDESDNLSIVNINKTLSLIDQAIIIEILYYLQLHIRILS